MSVAEHVIDPESTARPAVHALPPAFRAALLDPTVWRDGLGQFSLATNLAVALVDAEGRLLTSRNPQPLWSLFRAKKPAGQGECPFALAPVRPCLRDQALAEAAERKQAEALIAAQKQAFEMAASGTPLMEVLEFLAQTLQVHSQQQAVTAIHLLSKDGTRFEHTAAPSLPEDYAEAIDRMEVRSNAGPCCAAIARGERIVVADVAASEEFAAFALPLGIRAGWSAPILSSDGNVLGTVATYYREVRQPHPQDALLGEVAARTASVIIERKRAEEALRQSEQLLRFVLDAMPQKLFTAKPNGDVDYLNPQWTEFTGLSVEQIKDWGWTQFIHPDDVEENVRVWQHAVATGEPFQFEHRFRRADGQFRWHFSRALPMRDAEGRIVMWVGSNTDIQEQKQLEAELREADRRKDAFLATLAHELRNPLAPIRNALEILKQVDGNVVALDQCRSVMERQLGQMVRLVDDLLDVSRISRDKLELHKERVELAAVVHSAVETSRPVIEAMGHQLTVSLPKEPVLLDADPTRLAQVFLNLLNNASKYSERGGQIWLTVQPQGHEVRTAYDGEETVAAAMTLRPEVILLDIGMPKLNGYDCARRIREQPWGKNAVLIALTGWGQEADKRHSREVGFHHHIVTPVDPAALQRLLAEVQIEAG
jgi:PAS domain S-box-containing protein